MKKGLFIVLGISVSLLIGFVSSLLLQTALDVWYPTLEKSFLTPPDLVFPVVWGVLYALMGISVGLIAATKGHRKHRLMWLFAVQLILNVTWNFFFFYTQSPIFGFANLLVLDVLAIIYYAGAWRLHRTAAWAFLPYLVWILFATYLNFYVMVNN